MKDDKFRAAPGQGGDGEKPQEEPGIIEPDPAEQLGPDAQPRTPRSPLPKIDIEYDAAKPYEQGLPPKEKRTSLRGELFSWAESVMTAVLIICLLFAFVVRTIGVVGPSMQQTMFEGDRLIVSDLGYEPRYGDIIIISKKDFSEQSIVKRIIATAGQRVDIDFQSGEVTVDGETLDERYINEPTYTSYDVTFPLTVPENCVFVMGDNRNHSTDSRDSDIGMVNLQEIVGRVLLRYWPLNEIEVFKRF